MSTADAEAFARAKALMNALDADFMRADLPACAARFECPLPVEFATEGRFVLVETPAMLGAFLTRLAGFLHGCGAVDYRTVVLGVAPAGSGWHRIRSRIACRDAGGETVLTGVTAYTVADAPAPARVSKFEFLEADPDMIAAVFGTPSPGTKPS